MTLVYPYDHHHALGAADITLLLGGKAANLATMAVDLGLPVPPAFTITTAACNAYLASGWDVRTVPAREIEPIWKTPLFIVREVPAFWEYWLRAFVRDVRGAKAAGLL